MEAKYLNRNIIIGNVTAKPGERAYGIINVDNLFADGQSMEIPFIIINGNKQGPTVYIQVAQHPSETWGLEGVYNVLNGLEPEKMSGTIIFSLPNPVGFRFAQYYPPHITHDINRVGYGDPKGSLMERIVNAWWKNFVEDKADYVIDIHGTPPKTFVYYEAYGVSPGISKDVAEKSEKMALLFSAEFVEKQVVAYGGGNSFRGACVDHGIPAIVPEVETGGAWITERGIRNILIYLDMIPGKIKLPEKQYVLKWTEDRNAPAVKTSKGGCFIPSVNIGDIVKKGDDVGIIYSPRTLKTIEKLKAHREGYISSIRKYPVKVIGETVINIHEIMKVIKNS